MEIIYVGVSFKDPDELALEYLGRQQEIITTQIRELKEDLKFPTRTIQFQNGDSLDEISTPRGKMIALYDSFGIRTSFGLQVESREDGKQKRDGVINMFRSMQITMPVKVYAFTRSKPHPHLTVVK